MATIPENRCSSRTDAVAVAPRSQNDRMADLMTTLPSMDRRNFLQCATLAAGGLAITSSLSAAGPSPRCPAARSIAWPPAPMSASGSAFPAAALGDSFSNYISEAEAAFIAHLGIKHLPLVRCTRVIIDGTSGKIIEERGKQLEAAVERFAHGLLVMVNIHNEDRAAELNPVWQEAFVRFWGSLAAHLSPFRPRVDHPGDHQRAGV